MTADYALRNPALEPTALSKDVIIDTLRPPRLSATTLARPR